MSKIEYEDIDDKDIIFQELKNIDLLSKMSKENNCTNCGTENENCLVKEIDINQNSEKMQNNLDKETIELHNIENNENNEKLKINDLNNENIEEILEMFKVNTNDFIKKTENTEESNNKNVELEIPLEKKCLFIKNEKSKIALEESKMKLKNEIQEESEIDNTSYTKKHCDENDSHKLIKEIQNNQGIEFSPSARYENEFINEILNVDDTKFNKSTKDITENISVNKISLKKDVPPQRLSELYSQFNATWKDRLKSRILTEEGNNSITDSRNIDIEKSDIYISNNPKTSISRPVCVESSCCSVSDENESTFESSAKKSTAADVSFDDNCENVKSVSIKSCVDSSSSDKVIAFLSKKDIKHSTTSCGLDSVSIDTCIIPRKPVCVESSCFSASDDVLNKQNVSHKYNIISRPKDSCDSESKTFPNSVRKPIYHDSSSTSTTDEFILLKSDESKNTVASNFDFGTYNENVEKNVTTCSTSTEPDSNIKSQATFSTQIDETYNNLEEKILPFVKSLHTIELRLKGRLSVFQRACVKQIASQHKLLMKQFGKGKDGYILLRKKVELVNAQKLYLEMKRTDMKRKKEKIEQDKAKRERLLNPPVKVSSGCQADFPESKKEPVELSKNAARKNRKKQWEQKQKQLAKRESGSQTVAPGFYLCPYCEDDIPETHQATHYPYCLSKYRSQIQFQSKSGHNDRERRLVSKKSARPSSSDRKQRSKSRDRIHNSEIDTIKKELEKIHDNDINSMVNVINELNKKCSVTGCNKKKFKTCDECMAGYCRIHYSPESNSSDKHFNCPVALERIEAEKFKKLGNRNPLLKTVEELSAPQFADGALLKKSRRIVKIVESNPLERSTSNNDYTAVITASPNIPLANINETRMRNGPILSFERNELHKKLRERIGHLADRRTK